MTEAVAPTPLDAELLAVDTLAQFRFTEMNIFQFGQAIDAIDGINDGLASSARSIANLYNEPDTQTVALQEPPSLSHPLAQERFRFLQSAPDFNEYIKSSQSQSSSAPPTAPAAHVPSSQPASPVPELDPSQTSSAAPLSSPPSNQEHAQNIRDKHTRPSPAPGTLRLPAPASSTQSEESAAAPGPSSDRQNPQARPKKSSGRAQLQIPVRAVRSPSPRRRAVPHKMGEYVMRASDSPVKRKAGELDAPDASSEEDDLPIPSYRRSSTAATPQGASGSRSHGNKRTRATAPSVSPGPTASTSQRRAVRATVEELQQIDAAKRIPHDERIVPQVSSAVALRTGSDRQLRIPEADAGQFSGFEIVPPPGAMTSSSRPDPNRSEATQSNSLATHTPFGKVAPHHVGDIPLSKPARMSILGALDQLSEGWKGFQWVRSYRSGKKHTIREKWNCLQCKGEFTCSRAGQNTNLKTHRLTCPLNTDAEGNFLPSPATRKPSALASVASSTAVGYTGRSLSGWLNGQQVMHPDVTRRLGLLMVVMNSLPFTHLSSKAHKRLIKSIDARATIAMVSPSTVRRDLAFLHQGLQADIQRQLLANDSLMALSHDAWTNKGFQHSFVAITGSYVGSDWEYREVLLSFDVLKEKHTGATFSGHILRTLKKYDIADKWLGSVTSNSTGTNHRMMDLLAADVYRDGLQQRRPNQEVSAKEKTLSRLSCSAFPRASMRHTGRWDAEENKVLCMNHHINIAIRDGFACFGVSIKTKAQQKDEDGNDVPFDSGKESSSDEEDGEEPEDPEVVNGGRDKGKGKERAPSMVLRSTHLQEEGKEQEEVEPDGDDSTDEEDYEPDMQPSDDELLSDDGGGPDANDTLLLDQPNLIRPKNAVAKLEAFVTAVHRGSQRRADFRKRMEKEFYQNRELAQAPFPSKPNTTRWNSHFSMIRMALPIREAIDAHCRAHIGSVGGRRLKFGEYLLTPAQWKQFELLQPILKLAAAATKKMEQASGTLYMVLDYHAILRDEIKRLIGESQSSDDLDSESKQEIKKFLEAVEAKLAKYRELALKIRLTLVAAILHPLHRLEMFTIAFPEHATEAEKALRDMLKELLGSADAGNDKEATPTIKAKSPERTEPDVIAAARARRMQQSSDARARQPERNEPDEVARYLDASFCPWRDTDVSPYKWWKDNEQVFPHLAKLARIILAIPGTSSSVERVFSQAALVSTNRRARLSSKAIAQLVTTKDWIKHGADDLVGLDPEARRCAESIARLPDV